MPMTRSGPPPRTEAELMSSPSSANFCIRLGAVTWFRNINVCCHRYQSLSSSQAGQQLSDAKRRSNEAVSEETMTAPTRQAAGRYSGPRTSDTDPEWPVTAEESKNSRSGVSGVA